MFHDEHDSQKRRRRRPTIVVEYEGALMRRRRSLSVTTPAPTRPPEARGCDDGRVFLVVYGMPGPQGSKSFKGISRQTGRGVMVESSKKVRPWRQDVQGVAEAVHAGAPPLDGPLVARMVFTLPKPASAPKTRRTYAMRKPDLSKLVRSTEDALTDAGVIADDARIVEFSRVAKVFPNEDPEALDAPGARIEIARLMPCR
jgi:Holliday junction resolvase RusA-like endonuclease